MISIRLRYRFSAISNNEYSLQATTPIQMADLWEEFFTDLASFLQLLSSKEENASVAVAETALVKLECYLSVLRSIIDALQESCMYYNITVFGSYNL